MAAWEGILNPKQIFEVTNYIKSMHGTNPVNPKAPEGNMYVEGAAVTDTLLTPIDTLAKDTLSVAVVK